MTKQSVNPEQQKTWTEWFEIPVDDFDRAKKFYEEIFKINIEAIDFGPLKMGIFPHSKVGCAICKGEPYKPGTSGVMVHMNANPDLNTILQRVQAAGGKVLVEKKPISPEHGFMGLFTDTEGNRLGLHSYS